MQRIMLAIGAAATLAMGAFGCSHSLNRARAEYHEDKAERAAEHGHYYKAAREERKAQHDEYKAETSPLP